MSRWIVLALALWLAGCASYAERREAERAKERERLDPNKWTGRVFCATGDPDPSRVSSYGCIVKDAETGRLADDAYADPAPGEAPQEDRQVYADLCGL